MDQESDVLDPYDLLEVPPELRPPTHYQLLGIDDFETDEALIAAAAKSRNAYLHQIAAGPHRKIVQQLMGEIAVARRTLLNAELRAEYDAYLLEPEEHPVVGMPPIQLTTEADDGASPAQATSAGGAARDRRQRAKKSTWAEWKLHAISASVLLSIVGIVYWVNRHNGERRAAEAGAVAKQSSARPKASSGIRSAAAPQAASSNRQQPAPVTRRKTRSLAPDFDVKQFLPAAAPAMSDPSQADPSASTNKAATKNGLPEHVVLDLPADWDAGIKLLDPFDQPLAARYSFDAKTIACQLNQGRVMIEAAQPDSKDRSLTYKKRKLTAGDAVAIETNLVPGAKSSAQLGIAIGPVRIALASADQGIEVRIRKQGSKKTLRVPLAIDSPTHSLTIFRSQPAAGQLRWLARSGKNNVSGSVEASNLPKQAPIGIFFTSPQEKSPTPIWFDNLQVGRPAKQPNWKPTKQQSL